MGLLKEAENQQAAFKGGFLGFPGSGKTFTASMLAIGISKRLGGNKPVAFYDTESGSDFLLPKFKMEGVKLLVHKSQAFKELLDVAKEAEEAGCCCLIVDSITHVWRELIEAYMRRRKISRMQFQHWGDLKKEWAGWTSRYLNSPMHIIVCGRAGYEYDYEENEEGKKDLLKVGTKMKVENEFGFEPSELIEMHRVPRGTTPGAGWIHRAFILKDRTDTINGAAFDFQSPDRPYKEGDWARTFVKFEPVFNALAIGGVQHAHSTATSDDLFGDDGARTASQRAKRVTIATEEIQGLMVACYPGQDAASKKAKATILRALFNTHSWTKVENMRLEELERGVQVLTYFNQRANASVTEPDEVVRLLGEAGALVEEDRAKASEAPRENGGGVDEHPTPHPEAGGGEDGQGPEQPHP